LFWRVSHLAQTPATYSLFVHVLDESGQIVNQVDFPLQLDAESPGVYQNQVFPLSLPTSWDASAYRVTIGLYRPETGERLPLQSAGPLLDPAIDGPNALLLVGGGTR
jgi:hypothetical protein